MVYDSKRLGIRMFVAMFSQDWSSINSLLLKSRALRLQSLQKLTELHEFLDFMSGSDDNFLSCMPANRIAEKWSRRRPDDVSDSAPVWDDIVTNRFLRFLFEICRNLLNKVGNYHDNYHGKTFGVRCWWIQWASFFYNSITIVQTED